MSALTTSSSSLLHFRNETNQMLTNSTNKLDQVFIDDEVQRFDADSYRQKYGERWKRLATSVRDVLQNDGTIIREYVIEDPSLLDQLSDDENDEIANENKPDLAESHRLSHQQNKSDMRTFTAYPANMFAHQPTNEVQMRQESVHAMSSAHDSNSQAHLSNQAQLMSLKNASLTSSKHNFLNRNSQEERHHQQQQQQSTRPVLTTFESAKQVSRSPNDSVQANQSQFARYFQPIYSRNDPTMDLKPQVHSFQSNDAHYQPNLQLNSNVKPNERSNQAVCQQMSNNFVNRTSAHLVVPSKQEDDEIVDKEVEVIHEKGYQQGDGLPNDNSHIEYEIVDEHGNQLMISGAEQLKELAACVNEIRQADGSIVKEYILNDPKVIEKIKNKLNQTSNSQHGTLNPKINNNDFTITNNDSTPSSKYQEVQITKSDLQNESLKTNLSVYSPNQFNQMYAKDNQSSAALDTCQSVQSQPSSQVQERIRTFQNNLNNLNKNSNTNESLNSNHSVIDSFLNYNSMKSAQPPQKPQRSGPNEQMQSESNEKSPQHKSLSRNQFELKTRKGKALHFVISSDCDATESDIEEVKSFFNKNQSISNVPSRMQVEQHQDKVQKQEYLRDYNFKSLEISGVSYDAKMDTNEQQQLQQQQQPLYLEATKYSVNASSYQTSASSTMNHKRSHSVDLLTKSSSLSNLLTTQEDLNRVGPTNVRNNIHINSNNQSNESNQHKPTQHSSMTHGLSAYKGLLTTTVPSSNNKTKQMNDTATKNHTNPYETIDESQLVNKNNSTSYRTNSQNMNKNQLSESTRIVSESLFPSNSNERMSSQANKTRINGNTYTKSNMSTHQKPQFVQNLKQHQTQHAMSNLSTNKMQNLNKSLNALDEIGSSGASSGSTINSNSSTLSNNLRNLQITPEMTEKLLLKLLLQQLASQHVQQQQQQQPPQGQGSGQDSKALRNDMNSQNEPMDSLKKSSTVKNRLVHKSSCNFKSLNQFEHLFNENTNSLSVENYQNSLKKQTDAKHSNSERVHPKNTASMGYPLY